MPRLREEITKTFTRLTRFGESQPCESAPNDAPDTRIGRQFGCYRIIRLLGAGGMGQIYLALDTRLGRHVALKFLPPELISDKVSLIRLEQEARAASALNHPNLLTIYEIGELEGEHFIASEFVEGTTLRSAMQRNILSVPLAIDIASQIASALSAAHAAGVVHRDLKPSNVMLRPDGFVKLIDFGLAKRLVRTSEGTVQHDDLTRTGTTMGTAEYMSPEQARGEEVDYHTDIWSLGVILYEMIARHRPFEGATQSHVMVAIQDAPLPPLPADKSIPPALHVIVARALAKKPKNRYASARDMLDALHAAGGLTPSASRLRIAPAQTGVTRRAKALLFIPALLAVVFAAGFFLWWSSRQPHWLRIEPVRQLTFNGRVQLATISPDGKYLAYSVGQQDGEQALYLKQIDSPADEIKIPPRRINYSGLTFAPDNQTLYVVEKDQTLTGRLYAVPLVGTRSNNPIIVDIDGPVSFSSDGDRFVFVQYQQVKGNRGTGSRSLLMLANRDGQNSRPMFSSSGTFLFRQPAWSPDDKRIAVITHAAQSNTLALLLVQMNGSESRRPMPDWRAVGQLMWTPDGKSLVASVETQSAPDKRLQLHQLAVSTGADHPLTNELAAYSGVSLSADSKQMTAIKTDSKAAIWISRPNDFAHGETLPGEAERTPTLVWSDAAHLVVNSRRNGFPNLGLLDTQTQLFNVLTNERFIEEGAAIIAGTNGKSVVFSSNRAGQFHIWRFDADTNKLRQLTFAPHYDEHPSVSPDGRWVVYTSWTQNLPHLYKIPAGGGPSVQVGNYTAEGAQISPDGKGIACYLEDPATGKWIIAVIPFDGNGQPRPIPQASMPIRWSPDGAALSFVRTDSKGISNIWRIPLNTGIPVQLTNFEDQSIPAFAWSPAGDTLACLRVSVGADVTLFKILK